MNATVCHINPPGHDWRNGIVCHWCDETRTSGEAIVSGLASRRGGDEDSAQALLDGHRAEVLNETADLFERAGRIVLDGGIMTAAEFADKLRELAAPGGEKATAAAATATPDSAAPDFFQPGRSYLVDGHEYRCRTVDTHPVKQEREAWGWFHRGDDRWQHRRFYDTEYARATPYAGEVGCG